MIQGGVFGCALVADEVDLNLHPLSVRGNSSRDVGWEAAMWWVFQVHFIVSFTQIVVLNFKFDLLQTAASLDRIVRCAISAREPRTQPSILSTY